MTRTVRDWLKTLPEPYKKQSLMNATVQDKRTLHANEPSLYDAIGRAFSWGRTPEGREYWEILYYAAKKGEVKTTPLSDKPKRITDLLPW